MGLHTQEPLIGTTRFAQNGGIRVAFEIQGEGDPLVLLHGFSQARQAWRDSGFVDAFQTARRGLILVDLRGHGESDKPHDSAAYELRPRAIDIVAVLEALAIERADILGYSMGGAVAAAVGVHFPDRCGSLILGGVQPYAQDMNFYRNAVTGGLDSWLAIIEGNAGPIPKEARAMFLDNDIAALKAAVVQDRPDLSRELAASGVPVMLYAGTADPVHALAHDFAARTGCRFLSLPGMNHMQAFFAVEQVVRRPSPLWAQAAASARPRHGRCSRSLLR